ncbi:MAG: hypothetical protein ACI8S6_000360 [Myxococcota bacterium]|jgi:hypothetical protein
MLSLLVWMLSAVAAAATVEIHTSLPIDVALDGHSAAQAFGPSTITLPDIAVGEHRLTIFRSGTPTSLPLELLEDTHVRLYVSAEEITIGQPDAPQAVGVAPQVELRSSGGASFRVRIDDGQTQLLRPEQPLRLDDLTLGEHTVEIARADGLVIWVRGSLTVQPGDELVIQVAEGRMIEVFGRPGAWRSGL